MSEITGCWIDELGQAEKLFQHDETGRMGWFVSAPSKRWHAVPMMFEDDLPETISDEDYDEWYRNSHVPDGVGCRMGPKIDGVITLETIIRAKRMLASATIRPGPQGYMVYPGLEQWHDILCERARQDWYDYYRCMRIMRRIRQGDEAQWQRFRKVWT